MSAMKRLWTKIARFAEGLDGVDDPVGDYILSLGKRIDKLERDVSLLARQVQSGAGGGIQKQ